MIKLIVVIKRNAAMSPTQFREYWRTEHARKVRSIPACAKYIRRYVQAHTLEAEYAMGEPAYDGTAEIWFDSVQDKDAFFSDPDYLANVAPDERVFADIDQTRFLLCREEQINLSPAESVGASTADQEQPTTMLDVHAPHGDVHTWKSFFIHLATIVIGLLIAVGLEQTVEHFHHRYQAHEARKRLLEEVKANGELAKNDAYSVRMHEKHLREALLVLDRARNHALLPTDHIITYRRWSPVQVAAWKIARDSGAAGYLSAAEQATFELANWDAETFNADNIAATAAIERAAIVINVDLLDRNAALPPVEKSVYFGEKGESAAEEALTLRSAGAPQISRLTPAQIERLEQAIQSSIYDDQMLLNDCRHLTGQAEEIPEHIHAD